LTAYYPAELPVPAGTATGRLLLEPLRPELVVLDYEAVIESREQLRLWSGSSWPADDFSLSDNLRDLEWHWREHQELSAFTYSVLEPEREKCLGCVYMRPVAELLADNHDLLQAAADETLIRFWICSSLLEGELERHLLSTLVNWLDESWDFSRVLFETRASNLRQVQLLETFPMRRALLLEMPRRGGTHVFFEA
jgi:hypothetical protein